MLLITVSNRETNMIPVIDIGQKISVLKNRTDYEKLTLACINWMLSENFEITIEAKEKIKEKLEMIKTPINSPQHFGFKERT